MIWVELSLVAIVTRVVLLSLKVYTHWYVTIGMLESVRTRLSLLCWEEQMDKQLTTITTTTN